MDMGDSNVSLRAVEKYVRDPKEKMVVVRKMHGNLTFNRAVYPKHLNKGRTRKCTVSS